MAAFKFSDLPAAAVRPGAERRMAYTGHLMLVIFDFSDGPQTQPDPPHQHPHEQVSYVVEGELLFFLSGEAPVHLRPGDGYTVPADVPHCIQLLTPRVRLLDAFTPLREDFLGK